MRPRPYVWTASQEKEATEIQTAVTDPGQLDAYRVILFNDDVHTFDEVIVQIIRATGCSRSKAEQHTWEVHTRGRSMVYSGPLPRCLQVSSILEEIDLRTEIQTA
ncbi:ATP-dependent Clp protease adaptor ClpS [Prosthecochloris sp. N3]|uniref:ATP-dependent Clp protease adaptor ClpS n=1 Tax=Prosthecochloris ethylica TaxID=2743976 RepID=A0ABR9XRU8_9CHLB|nr:MULTISPECIES: ATP-dependent Clp protease adaptor ClpS [Prosthecochloris]MEC9487185.1 ATP-dependent Clp protease adaptor ClpS [Prosthecochloris sp.]MBF0585983.1 ATP-dependent Clp protease adaptor ClpS [Prosthecochloris ethylica]MBF0636617.1 ATP-dependent Clp protease adaptor ClpS [Prosthecochloris ethylica]NUK47249.1 ATP-dependent Clp protease adaptor ClpS [Prosthecochloris ethylica]RNA64049.1 ATP-dependent Clp protease adaptor ClpS [Prosthecochloris sp. ZM_2]